jgi:hypothetical protein
MLILARTGQHHQILLGGGRRAGFFIGDGAGVGKVYCDFVSVYSSPVKLRQFNV